MSRQDALWAEMVDRYGVMNRAHAHLRLVMKDAGSSIDLPAHGRISPRITKLSRAAAAFADAEQLYRAACDAVTMNERTTA